MVTIQMGSWHGQMMRYAVFENRGGAVSRGSDREGNRYDLKSMTSPKSSRCSTFCRVQDPRTR